MQLGGYEEALEKGATTILKDNISWHMPYLSANTTPWQLEGVIRGLRGAGYDDLVAVHNNTVVTDPYKGEKLNKLTPLYERYCVPELFNFKSEDMGWIHYKPKTEMLALDKVFPDGIHIPDYFAGKNIVHLPTVKCHIYTTTTGAMKNAFGGLLNTRRHYTHTWIHETLVDLLAIQQDIHSGVFAVMDGTLAGNGPGPRTMQPVKKDVMLAGSDQVAIDAVAAKLMGFDPMSLKFIRLAHERGLGIGDPSQIEIVGDTDVAEENWHFHVGHNAASRVGHGLWFGPLGSIQKLFFHTPLVYAFIFASFFYHDYIWWPFKGRPIQHRVWRETDWGRLFAGYTIAEDAERFVPSPESGACKPHDLPDEAKTFASD
ncbi:MAG: DUF362 domain-containing protein [Coriobacteriales bacterium]|nr:DUF362 domain-containing protein [Coriobacteriales bacterium]